ncbi:MAG: FG-GAP-like repeat-containing protein [Flavobacteriales bacterium]|nr:MAG: FG-GAP-like repeat-containing protein [Flavobacteriales bacterium]
MVRFTALATVLLSTTLASGQFGPEEQVTSLFLFPEEIMTADMDGDLDQDLVMRNAGAIVWARNLGQGSFDALDSLYASNWGSWSARSEFDLADVDQDGDMDLVVLDRQDSLVVWLPNASGSGDFGPALVIADLHGFGELGAIRCTDIMGDASPDLIVNHESFSNLKVYVNDGGTFASIESIHTNDMGSLSRLLVIGDIDLNGTNDIIRQHWSGQLWAMLNPGGIGNDWTDTLLIQQSGGGYIFGSGHQQLIDVDADGDLDLVDAANDNTPVWAECFAADSGGFHAFLPEYIGQPVHYFHTGWAAFLGCGNTASALWCSGADSDSLNWTMYDAELDAFGLPAKWASEPGIRLIRTADLDGDGRQDLILAHSDSVLSWYPNDLPALPSSGISLTPFDTLCASGDPYALDHAEPPGGNWSGEGVAENNFMPPGPGSFTLTYQVVDPVAGCPLSATQAITVLLEPIITVVSGSFDDCDTAPLQLAGWPSGGSWSGSSDESGYVDKSCAVRPLSGEVYYNMEAVNGGFCQASTITFVLPACTPVDLGSDINACEEDEQDIVVELFMPSSSYFVELQGPFYDIVQPVNNLAQGFFNPAVGPGSFMIIGNVMNPFTCPGSDTLFIIVNPNPDPGLITTNLTFCANQSEGLVEMNMAGDFSAPINAASTAIGTFNPGLLSLGYHPFSFNVVDANGCAGFLIDSLLIVDPPVVSLDMSPININGGIVILEGGSPEGGTYTVNGEVATALDPSTFQAGDLVDVAYSYTDPLTGCTGMAAVQVDIVTALGVDQRESGVHVFPNPATSECQVWFGSGNSRISLLDALGREARNWPSMTSPAWLNLNGLPAGNYVMTIEAPDRMDRIRLTIR